MNIHINKIGLSCDKDWRMRLIILGTLHYILTENFTRKKYSSRELNLIR